MVTFLLLLGGCLGEKEPRPEPGDDSGGEDTAETGASDSASGETGETGEDGETGETGWIDEDGDGYPIEVDCDDANGAVHPEAGEACGNGIDDDCTGDEQGCRPWDVDLSLAHATIVGSTWESLGSGFGLGDVTDDGKADLILGVGQESGVVSSPIYGSVPSKDIAERLQSGFYNIKTGIADIDGDGTGDVAIGKSNGHELLLIFSGRALWDADLSEPSISISPDEASTGDLGRDLAIGDGDGDGQADLLVDDLGCGAYLLLGPVTADGVVSDLASLALVHIYQEEEEIPVLGQAVDLADVTGDGRDDLFVSDNAYNLPTPYTVLSSSVFMVDGERTGEFDTDEADAQIHAAAGAAGYDLASGDTDGDGYEDLFIGAPGSSAVFIVNGPIDAYVELPSADAAVFGEINDDGSTTYLGEAIASGDVDGDGLSDLLVGATEDAQGGYGEDFNAGAANLLYAPFVGTWDLSITGPDRKFVGEIGEDLAGWAVALGDADGDGRADVAIGAPESESGGDEGGVIYLFYGL